MTMIATFVTALSLLLGHPALGGPDVKCDAATNPEEVRDAGQVVTQIGVAVTKPAEFVIFQISQWAGPGQ